MVVVLIAKSGRRNTLFFIMHHGKKHGARLLNVNGTYTVGRQMQTQAHIKSPAMPVGSMIVNSLHRYITCEIVL